MTSRSKKTPCGMLEADRGGHVRAIRTKVVEGIMVAVVTEAAVTTEAVEAMVEAATATRRTMGRHIPPGHLRDTLMGIREATREVEDRAPAGVLLSGVLEALAVPPAPKAEAPPPGSVWISPEGGGNVKARVGEEIVANPHEGALG